MFETGDYVLNAKNGICKVEGIVNLEASISNSDELYYLLIPIEEMYIQNDKEREKQYKEAIQSCRPENLISIIKSMYLRKQSRLAQGKKNTAVDEKYFKIAENNLYAELAFALDKKKNEMQKLIAERVKENA